MSALGTKGLEERAKILKALAEKAGVEKVETWLSDPIKLRIVNALAASFAKGL